MPHNLGRVFEMEEGDLVGDLRSGIEALFRETSLPYAPISQRDNCVKRGKEYTTRGAPSNNRDFVFDDSRRRQERPRRRQGRSYAKKGRSFRLPFNRSFGLPFLSARIAPLSLSLSFLYRDFKRNLQHDRTMACTR